MSTGTINLSTVGGTKETRVTVNSSANAYTSGQQVGTLLTIPCSRVDGFGSVLQSISVIDKSKIDLSLDVLLFNAAPTVTSADHATVNITFANATGKAIGFVNIASYSDLSAISIGESPTISKAVTPASGMNIYALVVARGSGTYAANALELIFSWLPDSLNQI